MLYFKVFSGFNDPNPISIDQSELATALKAQITGKVAIFKNGTISGNQISKILPDYNKVEKIYNPSGPDYLPKGAEAEHQRVLENAQEIVVAGIEGRKPMLKLSENPSVVKHTQGLTALGDLLN